MPNCSTLNTATINEVELREVSCVGAGGEALSEISVSFARGRFHIVRGMLGEGRDLLLRVLGLLQPPEAGEVVVQGIGTRKLSEESRAALRTQRFGFVFATPFLLSSFSVIENVAMPLFKVSQVGPDEARRRTEILLGFVGLAEAAELSVDELSPAAQFRAALARGLVNEPSCLLVENLDGVLAGGDLQSFLEVLRKARAAFGTTIIASASPAISLAGGERVLDMVAGRIAGDSELLPESGQ